MSTKYLFKQVIQAKGGFLRGPFGGDLKKEIFVDKGSNTYKVYEQGVVLNSDKRIGRYYISEKDYKAKLHKFSVQHKDFLVSCSGVNMGAIYQLKEPFERGIINQALLRIRLNTGLIDDNYFYYLFKELISRKITSGSGDSTIPNFPGLDLIKNIEFDLPDLNTQIKVGNILSALDSKIELNNRINFELEAMAKTLYDYWFVQFDFPFDFAQGKPYSPPSEGCPQDGVGIGKPYKSGGGKMVWNEELKRAIPEGWKVAKMAEWIESEKSGDWGKEEPEGNFTMKVTCIRGADINGLNGLAELKPPVRYILDKNSTKVLNSHDLIIEISGGSPTQSTGRIAFITDATIKRFENPLICSNFCKPLSIKNKKLLYNFVYYWNSLYDAGIFFGYEGKTSGIKNLLLDSFVSSYYTVVPDDKIVDKFYDIMENIQGKKQIGLAENQQLSSLRDWLLPMLMNGQVTVGETTKKEVKKSERNIYQINMQKLLHVASELHKRGYEKLRVVPSVAPTGLAWRCSFVAEPDNGIVTSTWLSEYSSNEREIEYSIIDLTELFEREHLRFLESCKGKSKDYVEWYQNMLSHLEEDELPYAFAEYFSPTDYWKTTNGQKIETLPNEKRFYYNY